MLTPTGFRWSSPSTAPTLSRWLRAARSSRVGAAVAVMIPALCVASLVAPATPASADSIGAAQAKAQRLSSQINVLSLRLSTLSEAYDAARLNLDQLNTKIDATKAGLATTDAHVKDAQRRVADLAITSYMRGGSVAELGIFVPQTMKELSIRTTYARTIAAGANDAIDAFRAAHAQLGQQQHELATEQTSAANAVAAADRARKSAASADAQLRAQLAQVQGELAPLVAAADAQQRADVANRLRSTRGASPSVGSTPTFNAGPLPPPAPGALGAVEWARRELGRPYEWGGSGPGSFDCSGLTSWAWGHAGHGLPHSAAAQYSATTHISISQLQPGDLVFYGSPPHHVGIYTGGGQMINALHSGTNVEYDSIYLEGDLIGGGRVN